MDKLSNLLLVKEGKELLKIQKYENGKLVQDIFTTDEKSLNKIIDFEEAYSTNGDICQMILIHEYKNIPENGIKNKNSVQQINPEPQFFQTKIYHKYSTDSNWAISEIDKFKHNQIQVPFIDNKQSEDTKKNSLFLIDSSQVLRVKLFQCGQEVEDIKISYSNIQAYQTLALEDEKIGLIQLDSYWGLKFTIWEEKQFTSVNLDPGSQTELLLIKDGIISQLVLEVRKVGYSETAPYEMVIDGHANYFYLCRFNFSATKSDLTKSPSFTITNLLCQNYSKPTNYANPKYLISNNFISLIANAQVIPKLAIKDKEGIQRRSYFLMIWEKRDFAKPVVNRDPNIEESEDIKKTHFGRGFTYRIERLSNNIITSQSMALEYNSKDDNKDPMSIDTISYISEDEEIKTTQLIRSAKIHKEIDTENSNEEEVYTIKDFNIELMSNFWSDSVFTLTGDMLFSLDSNQSNSHKMTVGLLVVGVVVLIIIMLLHSLVKFLNVRKKNICGADSLSKRRGIFCKNNFQARAEEEETEESVFTETLNTKNTLCNF